MRYFVAVADTLNFTRAAESMYVSQSALSKQISELEQEMGVTLFERDKRNVALTQAGRILLPEAKNILIQSEKLVPLLRHESEQWKPLRSVHIAIENRADDFSALHRVVTDVVCRQRESIPGLRALFWRDEYLEIKKNLQDGTRDLGIFLHTEPALGESLASQVLLEDEMVLVFRSRTPRKDDRESILELLRNRGVILLEKEPRGLGQILSILDAIGSAPQIRFCRDRTALTLTMESGESTVVLPESIARRLSARDLHILHFQHPSAKLYLLAGWREDVPNELARRIALETRERLLCPEEPV